MPHHRLEWIDLLKGFMVLWMVFFQASLRASYHVEEQSIVYTLAMLGRPVRMPVMFMLAGLLFAPALSKTWRELINNRILFFLYLFVVWTLIMTLLRNLGTPAKLPFELGLFLFYEPFGSLWFLIVVALMMVLSYALKAIRPIYILVGATALELLQIGPFYAIFDNVTRYWLYFLIGLYGRVHILQLAQWFGARVWVSLLTVICFLLIDFVFVTKNLWETRGILLLLSLAGVIAAIALAQLLTRINAFSFLKWAGRHSLVFFVGYFPAMLIAAQILKTRLSDHNLYSLILFVIGVSGALALYFVAKRFGLMWLYEKPNKLTF